MNALQIMFVAINIWLMLAYAYRLKVNHYYLYDDSDEYDEYDEYDDSDEYDDTGPDTIDADRARIDRINECISDIENETG